MICWYQLFYP